MNAVDICIIIFLLFGFFIGFKNGFTKQLVSTVGFILVVILSYLFKNVVSSLFYTYLPFIKFKGAFEGVNSLNILLYELLAFVIVFSLFMSLFKVLVRTTNILEKFLNATIILGIPSKILGGITGTIENYVIAFFAIYFLSIPMLETNLVKDSTIGSKMLDNTPILSNICDDTLEIYEEVNKLKEEYIMEDDKSQLNQKIIDLLLERGVVTQSNIDTLIARGKIQYVVQES